MTRYRGTPQFDALGRIYDTLQKLAPEVFAARSRKDTEAITRIRTELTEAYLVLQEVLRSRGAES